MQFRPYLLLAFGSALLLSTLAGAQQSPNSSSSVKNAKPEQHPATKPTVEANVYRNAAFGFRYSVILGWVDRTSEMQPEEKPAGDSASAQGKVLLAVFERPPEVSNQTINSAVVIAEESASSYPGLKTAADYVGPLTELVTKSGFKVAGEPSEVTIDSRTLVECDFTRGSDKLPAYQTTLILLHKGTVVSFTFIGASADEVKGLIDRLSFQPQAPGKPK
jgi:hypothetical protein